MSTYDLLMKGIKKEPPVVEATPELEPIQSSRPATPSEQMAALKERDNKTKSISTPIQKRTNDSSEIAKTGNREIVKQGIPIYKDQLNKLKDLQYEMRHNGNRKPSYTEILGEALDDYFKKKSLQK